MDKRFTSLQVWVETHKLFKLLAETERLPISEFMHRLATELAADYVSIEEQDE